MRMSAADGTLLPNAFAAEIDVEYVVPGVSEYRSAVVLVAFNDIVIFREITCFSERLSSVSV